MLSRIIEASSGEEDIGGRTRAIVSEFLSNLSMQDSEGDIEATIEQSVESIMAFLPEIDRETKDELREAIRESLGSIMDR